MTYWKCSLLPKRALFENSKFCGMGEGIDFQNWKENIEIDFSQGRINMTALRLLSWKVVG